MQFSEIFLAIESNLKWPKSFRSFYKTYIENILKQVSSVDSIFGPLNTQKLKK